MAKELSIATFEAGVHELSNILSNAEWDDEVKDSYVRFIDEQKQVIANMKWTADKANSIFNSVNSVNVDKFKSTYNECVTKFERLQRGN